MQTIELKNLSTKELLDLNKRVVEMIKLKRRIEGVDMMQELEPGMTVKYVGGTNKIKNETFTVKKIKRVNVLCESNVSGGLWNIKPANLEIVKK